MSNKVDLTGGQKTYEVPTDKKDLRLMNLEFSLHVLANRMNKIPMPSIWQSPFTRKEGKRISALLKGPNGSQYFKDLKKIINASDGLFEQELKTWREEVKAEWGGK